MWKDAQSPIYNEFSRNKNNLRFMNQREKTKKNRLTLDKLNYTTIFAPAKAMIR
jgi:hypothetical protein